MPSLPHPSPLRRAAVAMLLAAVPVGVAACGPKDPELRVQSAAITGATVAIPPVSIGLIMAVTVSAKNDNSFDIQVQGARGQVTILNNTVQVSTAIGTWLKADATTNFVVPVTIPIQTALGLLGASANIACIPYTFNGSADVVATSTFKINKPNYPMSQNGCIPRLALLSAVRPYNPSAM